MMQLVPATSGRDYTVVASSHDATGPCDLLQGLVASCVVTLRAGSWQLANSLPGFAGHFHCFTSQDMLRK